MLDLVDAHKLEGLIKAATDVKNEGSREEAEKKIKRLVRKSEALVERSFELLMEKMSAKSSTVRLLALEVVHLLMLRSKVFRDRLNEKLHEFLHLAVAFNSRKGLPPPHESADALRRRTLEMVREWSERYGSFYKALGHTERYLSHFMASQKGGEGGSHLGSNPNQSNMAASASASRNEKIQRILHDKFLEILQQLPDLKPESALIVQQIEACLEVLEQQIEVEREREDEESGDDDSSSECEGLPMYAVSEDAGHGGNTSGRPSTEVRTKDLVTTLQDLLNLLHKKYVRRLHLWHDVLVRYDPSWGGMSSSHRLMLQSVIDMRNAIQQVEVKSRAVWSLCTSLPFPSLQDGESDDVKGILRKCEADEAEFEDVPDAVDFTFRSEGQEPTKEGIPGNDKGKRVRADREESPPPFERAETLQDRTEHRSKVDSKVRAKLLQQAPVVADPESIYVNTCDVMANNRGLEIEGHWGATDDTAVMPERQVAMLNRRVSFYQAPKGTIPVCGAKLKTGLLCQRRDKKVCPFHGPIVPRDEHGNPTGTMPAPDGSNPSPPRSQKDLDREHNVQVVRELAGEALLSGPATAETKARGKACGSGVKKVSHRKRIEQKLSDQRKNKVMKKLLSHLEDERSRNHSANKW